MNHLPGPGGPGLALLGVFITLVNVGLLIALFVLFLQAYRRMKTPFGLGLLVFVVVLLIQDLLQVAVAWYRTAGRPPPFTLVLPDALELVALLVLLYLATR